MRLNAHEKVILVDSNSNEITSINPLVVSFSASLKPLQARSPKPAILSSGDSNALGTNANPLILKVF